MDCDVAFNGATTGAHSAKVVKPCEPLKDTTTSLAHNGKRPIINDVNPEITCVLCAGYFVNATTIVECLHTFCKSCIVKYLDTNKSCPICELPLSKVKPLQSLREDKIRQELVYKIVPHLYKDEITRRQTYYLKDSDEAPVDDVDAGLVTNMVNYYKPSDKISMSIEYFTGDISTIQDSKSNSESMQTNDENYPPRRYLLCPAALSMFQLKKFITNKFDLMNMYKVDILYGGEILDDESSIMDVAYSFAWGQSSPMRFFYRIIKKSTKPLLTIGSVCSVQQPTRNSTTSTTATDTNCKDATHSATSTKAAKVGGKLSRSCNTNTNNKNKVNNNQQQQQPEIDQKDGKIRLVKSLNTYEISRSRSSRSLANRIVPQATKRTASMEFKEMPVSTITSDCKVSSSAGSNKRFKVNGKDSGASLNLNCSITAGKSGTSNKSTEKCVGVRGKVSGDTKVFVTKDAKTQTSVVTTKPTIIKLVQRPYTMTKSASTGTDAGDSDEDKEKVSGRKTRIGGGGVGADRKHMPTGTNTSSSSTSANSNTNNNPTSRNSKSSMFSVKNLIDNQKSECKPSTGGDKSTSKSFVSVSTLIGSNSASNKSINSTSSTSTTSSTNMVSSSSSSSSISNKSTNRPTLLTTTPNTNTTSSNSSSSSTKSTNPLSPPSIRIKLTCSPNQSSNSLYGQIISPKPPEVIKEQQQQQQRSLKHSNSKESRNSTSNTNSHKESRSEMKSIKSNTSSSTSSSSRYKVITSQGVQSSMHTTNSRPRGEMIHQIIDKMTSKVTNQNQKQSAPNVSSTTPSFESIINKSKQSNCSSLTSTTTDSEVSTTTGGSGNGGEHHHQQQRSSGNLVLRISTKTLETKPVTSSPGCSPSSTNVTNGGTGGSDSHNSSFDAIKQCSVLSSSSSPQRNRIDFTSKQSPKQTNEDVDMLNSLKQSFPSPTVASSSDLIPVSDELIKSANSKLFSSPELVMDIDDDSIDVDRKLVVDMGDSDSEHNDTATNNDGVGSDCENDSGRGSSSSTSGGSDIGTIPLMKSSINASSPTITTSEGEQPFSSPKTDTSSSTPKSCLAPPTSTTSVAAITSSSISSPPPAPSPKSDSGSNHSVEMLLSKPSSRASPPDNKCKSVANSNVSKCSSNNSPNSSNNKPSQSFNIPLDLSMGTVKKVSSPVSSPPPPLPLPTHRVSTPITSTTQQRKPSPLMSTKRPTMDTKVRMVSSKGSSVSKKCISSLSGINKQNLLRNFISLGNSSPTSSTVGAGSTFNPLFALGGTDQGRMGAHTLTGSGMTPSPLLSPFNNTPFNTLNLLNQSRNAFPGNFAELASSLATLINNSPAQQNKLKSKSMSGSIKSNYTRLVSTSNNRESNVRFVDKNTNGVHGRLLPSSTSLTLKNGTSGSGGNVGCSSSNHKTGNSTKMSSKPMITIRKVGGNNGNTNKSTSSSSTSGSSSSANSIQPPPPLPFSTLFHH